METRRARGPRASEGAEGERRDSAAIGTVPVLLVSHMDNTPIDHYSRILDETGYSLYDLTDHRPYRNYGAYCQTVLLLYCA